MKVLINVFLAVLATAVAVQALDCEINVKNDLNHLAPLLLKKNAAGKFEFLYPDKTDKDNIIKVAANAKIYLKCTSQNANANQINEIKNSEAEIVCVGGKKFKVNGKEYEIKNLAKCKDENVVNIIDKTVSKTENIRNIAIGFQVNPTEFLSTIELMFDRVNKVTLFTKHSVLPTLNKVAQAKRCHQDEGFDATHYGYNQDVNANRCFSSMRQRRMLISIVGEKAADNYFKTNKYLTRGRLAACNDFTYISHKKSTFYYVNVAPQWEAFDNGEWNNLETKLRTLAEQYPSGFVVYTGTSGVMTFPDANKVEQKYYLYNENKIQKVPVPKYFWKVIIDLSTGKARAFLGLNTPVAAQANWYKGLCDPDVQISGVKKVVSCPVNKLLVPEFSDVKTLEKINVNAPVVPIPNDFLEYVPPPPTLPTTQGKTGSSTLKPASTGNKAGK